MTPEFFAKLTLETWRASGARTEMRRDYLMTRYLETYFGHEMSWSTEVRQLEISARLLLRKNTRIDELVYA
jgi:hypothetical protein